MKTKLFFASMLTLAVSQTVLSQTDEFGYTSINLSMGAQYQNQVYFDFSSNNIISQPATGWDIAFYRNSSMAFGERVNDANNVKVYQVSADPAAFDTVVPGDKANWGEPLYNPDKTEALEDGVFDNATLLPSGGLNFSWGTYDITTHKITGKVVFVLEYGNGDYYKFFINEYAAGYTFKYAKWNGSSWDATQTRTIANGTDDAFFNYFSFATGAKVNNIEPPKANWDLMFTRYWTFYNNIMMYLMSGTIQSPNVSVAYVRPETQATSTYTAPASGSYSKEITTIGHSWKGTTGSYTDAVYYVKEGSNYYRMYFTSNGGASTGNMYFKYKNITGELAVADFGKKGTFGIYPNPTKEDKKVNILFDVKEAASKNGSIEVFDFSGKKVYETAIVNQSGFSTQQVDLNKLSSGVYVVKIAYGGQTETKKLVVK
ncbi:T9SS type A sorting domain-containing protein [Epilithonimonas zeae]|uniref:T9SS type A sorting domain-containing protein n=1 Tax=Epilithonimonas zeae TaxID=1416779 RepID=UPI00200C9627|nr:T9SS type A sorting domain-containing protein [Epilithonimonas zeae]UQB69642.1 T9SS type A sorting domain-containing protein [Epilithonimonas zeae]